MYRLAFLAAAALACFAPRLPAAGFEAFHRNGQTFLAWPEVASVAGETYRIYRDAAPIGAARLAALTPIGDAPEGSSIAHEERRRPDPNFRNYAVRELAPLDDATGLFVWTPGAAGTAYYAVAATSPDGKLLALHASEAIAESADRPRPLLLRRSEPAGQGFVYLQFADLRGFNTTLRSYIFPYIVLAPQNLAPGQAAAVRLELHAYNCNPVLIDGIPGRNLIIWPYDHANTWWFGWSSTHDYRKPGNAATGPIANYTEQAAIRALFDTIDDPPVPVDEERIVLTGHSMGATGALRMGLNYPGVFSAVYAAQGLTDIPAQRAIEKPADDPAAFIDASFDRLWGPREIGLKVDVRTPEFRGRAKQPRRSPRAVSGLPVWSPADLGAAADAPLLMFDHGTRDALIDFATQGPAFYRRLDASGAAWSARWEPIGHTYRHAMIGRPRWLGPDHEFGTAPEPWANSVSTDFRLRRGDLRPAFSGAAALRGEPAPSADLHRDWNVLRSDPKSLLISTSDSRQPPSASLAVRGKTVWTAKDGGSLPARVPLPDRE